MKRKNYSKPSTRAIALQPEKLMIPISGHTTPQEADAKGSFFDFIIRDNPGSWE